MEFEFFDPTAPMDVTHRNLPHWFQTGATYFVTFRTVDSLPAAVIERWQTDRQRWLRAHGIDTTDPAWESRLQHMPREVRIEFYRTHNEAFHALLDAGHGAYVLKRPELARVVADAILYFDGTRYYVSDFVVMPNHVHILMGLIGSTCLDDVCYSLKKFTATKMNAATGSRGHFWQGESFDHIVRSPDQFDYFRGYMAANPTKARLRPDEYIRLVAK